MAFGKGGQASVEMVSIIGISLIVVTVFLVLSSEMMSGFSVQQNFDDAYYSVRGLAQAADSVSLQGEGASKAVTIILPTNTVFGADKTYIGAPAGSTAPPNTININVNGTDVFSTTRAPLSGSFPPVPGAYTFKVSSNGTGVSIYPYLVEIDRRAISVSVAAGETRKESVRIYSAASEGVQAVAALPWKHADVHASVLPGTATPSAEGTPFFLEITSAMNASGIYSSTLFINAYGESTGATETLHIPVSVVIGSS